MAAPGAGRIWNTDTAASSCESLGFYALGDFLEHKQVFWSTPHFYR